MMYIGKANERMARSNRRANECAGLPRAACLYLLPALDLFARSHASPIVSRESLEIGRIMSCIAIDITTVFEV